MHVIYILCPIFFFFLFSEWKSFAKFTWITVLFVMFNLLEFPWKLFFHKLWDRQREKHASHWWEKELIWAVWYLVVWITSSFFFTMLWNINLTNAAMERSRIKWYGPKPLNLQFTVAYYVAMFTGTWQFVFSLMQILRTINWICTLCCLYMWFYHII